MTETAKTLPVLLAHFIIGLCASLLWTFVSPAPESLIEPFILNHRLYEAFLLFIRFFPALMISGILLGYALSFGKAAEDPHVRLSPRFLKYLKGAFLLFLGCVAFQVILDEGVAPSLESSLIQYRSRSDDYREFIHLGISAESSGDYDEGERAALSALQIWKKSSEAEKLLESIRYSRADTAGRIAEVASVPVKPLDLIPPGADSFGVLELLKKTEQALEERDYCGAHYYAMKAWSLASDTDPNKIAAMDYAAHAWNEIGEGSSRFIDSEEKSVYSDKLAGYSALQSGDALRAYYIFSELQERIKSIDGRIDTDVDRFLVISLNALAETHFFIDETDNARPFESSRDVFFAMHHPDGSADYVFVRGITYLRSSGRDMAYLRGFELVRLDKDGSIRFHFETPYAKMFAARGMDGKERPQVLLRAVSRESEGVTWRPIVKKGSPSEAESAIQVLDMPYDDFALVVSANRGIRTMQLADIIRFINRSELYGFPKHELSIELISRLSEPFLLMILAVFALILAWRYRLGQNSLFKAWWVIAVPLFPFACIYAVETVRYLARIVISHIVQVFPSQPVILILAVLFAGLFGVSVLFFAQRTE